MTPLPIWVHEWFVAPTAFGLAALHARRALGTGRATLEMLSLALYGFALEWAAIVVFHSHDYGSGWRVAVRGVPVAVALAWAAVIVSALSLAARLGLASAAARAAGAALIGITLDLLMEPVAVQAGFWRWTPPGPWLSVPVGNFVGWGVILGVYVSAADTWAGERGALREAARRIGLAALSILALLAVGTLWRSLGVEGLFASGRAWFAWAGFLLAALGLVWYRSDAGVAGSLGQRLGAAAGRLPVAALALLAWTFALDAVALDEPRLMAVAFGSVVTLTLIAWTAGRPA